MTTAPAGLPTPLGIPRQGAPAAPAVRTSGLTKRFGARTAVDGIDLTVPEGAVFGFLGPNGSGKTTTIRMLLGLVGPDAGTVELLGRPMPAKAAAVLPEVGALVEGPAFYPYLSGAANLVRFDACDPAADPRTRRTRIDAVLHRVGLTNAAGKRFRQYSLGMKQRLGIAAALLQPRRLLVLDEPTNGLDPQGTREVRTLVRTLAADGVTVLVSSHLLSEVEQMATHVGIMSAGRLLAQGPLEDVLAAAGTTVVVRTPRVETAVEVLRRLGVVDATADAAGRSVSGHLGEVPAEAVAPALVASEVPVLGLEVARPALEELFVSLTGEGFDVAG